MFSPKKQPETSKIRLPKAAMAPAMQELQFLYSQCTEQRGREVELVWSEPGNSRTYSIGAKMDMQALEPTWTLWEDDGRESKLVWRYDTTDFDLVNDVVRMLEKQKNSAPATPTEVNRALKPSEALRAEQMSTGQFTVPAAGTNPSPAMTQVPSQAVGPIPSPPPGYSNAAADFELLKPEPFKPSAEFSQASGAVLLSPNSVEASPQPAPVPPSRDSSYTTGSYAITQQPATGDDIYDSPIFAATNTQTSTGSHQIPQQRPISHGFVPPFAPAAKQDTESVYAASSPKAANAIQGRLEDTPVATLLPSLQASQVTGKLEILGEDTVGDIFFEFGNPKHAGTPTEYGDGAIRELVTWEKGTFIFTPGTRTEMKSVEQNLSVIVAQGIQLLDQKQQLKKAGLKYESYLIRRHKNLSDTELRLMLTKGVPMDFDLQKSIYTYLGHRRTFTDLLRDKPMDSSTWSTLIYNFLSCGLIEIKQPDAVKGSSLDFLGDARGQVQTLTESFTRQETGIYSFPALMYFMEYEFNRYTAYNFPMSLIVFEMQKKRDQVSQVMDLLSPQAAAIAALRIDLVKRNLDTLGHFEAVDYAILLPNTTASSASFVANRIYESLTATPLAPGVDKNTLIVAFGVASLPSDGDTLEALVHAAKAAKEQAKIGTFPIVLHRAMKRD